ncbi:MAG: hypothetical protein RLZZ511_503 [Cyanobacteriota bacterium]|jgi:hypothetical protein
MMQAPEIQRLGSYLVEAGLVTPAQIDVALSDQRFSEGMRIGEILVMRGWIKQQTLDFVITKVVEPEQTAARQQTLDDGLIRRYQPRPADTTVIQPLTAGRSETIAAPRLSDPATPRPPQRPLTPTAPATTHQPQPQSIAQARSLDGSRIIEILRPKTDYSAPIRPQDLPTDPGNINDRKSLSSIPDEDDMNWVG